MAKSNAFRDTQAVMGVAIRMGRGHQLASIFKDKKYISKLEEYKKSLLKNQEDLDKLFEELEQIFGKDFFQESILDNLISIMKDSQGEMASFNNLRELINQQFNSYSSGQQRALNNFLYQYWKTKDDFLKIADEMETTNIGLKGGQKQDQYYGIFLKNVQHENGEQFSSLLKITREQYDLFEKANPDLFIRKNDGSYSLKLDVRRQDIYNRMSILFPESEGPVDILDQIYASKTVNGNSYNLSTRQIYNILRSSGNLISTNSNITGITRLSEITQARRLEMLFDNELISGIQKLVTSKGIIGQNGNLEIKRQDVLSVIKSLDFNKYKGENIYGGVAGDVELNRNGILEDYQLKYKGGDRLPWNGRNYRAVINNIDGYLETGKTFLSDPSKLTELETGNLTSDDFFNFIEADPVVRSHYENIGYQATEDFFLSEMPSDGFQIDIVI